MQKLALSDVYQFLEKREISRFRVIEPEGTAADIFKRLSGDGFASAAAAGSAGINMPPCDLLQRRFYRSVSERVHVAGPYGPAVFFFIGGIGRDKADARLMEFYQV